MPAATRGPSNGGWGITYADVSTAQAEHEGYNACSISWAVFNYAKFKGAKVKVWTVVAYAKVRAGKPNEVCGIGQCDVGGNKGAASMPGAYLRALIDACNDLEKRRQSPTYDRELARLPGFEER